MANRLKQLWDSGKPAVNGWLAIPSGFSAEVMAQAGWDSVTVDLQHGVQDYMSMVACFQAMQSHPVLPMVRVPWNEPGIVGKVLDAGAYGIICPMISTASDAARLVAACRYPPVGARSFGPARGLLYGGLDYFTAANTEILVFAMIETQGALDNLDAILDTPGLDGIYFGPNDLAIELGCAPRNEHDDPTVVAAIARGREGAARRGLIAGMFCSDGPAAARRVAEGFHLVTPGNDAALLRATFAASVKTARG